MKKNLTECIGTFVLLFTIGCAVASGSTLAPVAIAAINMAIIYAGYHISGAHYNPAVTLAVLLCKKISTQEAIMYVVFQLVGGILGAFASYVITDGSANAIAMAPGSTSPMNALFAEIVGTFILVYVILNVAMLSSKAQNDYYGLAIGFTVLVGAYSVGGISGGAFNPAVGVGPNIFQCIVSGPSNLANIAIYMGGPFAGAALAGFIYKYINAE